MENTKAVYLNREVRLNHWLETYSEALLQTCVYMLPDRAQAEDAVQDTLIKAWRYLGKRKENSIVNERAWLMRIAINTCKDYLRTGWFQHVDRSRPDETIPPKMLSIDPEEPMITFLVKELPAKYRQVVLLHYFQGMTQQEIAEMLKLSISTVNRNLRKAEVLIREKLEEAQS